jgi:hypothetical protein
MHSTSISKCPGHTGTATKNTARRFIAKVPVIDFIDFRKLFLPMCNRHCIFNTLASDDPAVSTQNFSCSSTSSVCLSIGASTTSPESGVKRGKPRDVDGDAMPNDNRGWSLPSLQISWDRFNTDNFWLHNKPPAPAAPSFHRTHQVVKRRPKEKVRH